MDAKRVLVSVATSGPFASAERHVVICSNDEPGRELVPHERHRSFTAWVAQECPESRSTA